MSPSGYSTAHLRVSHQSLLHSAFNQSYLQETILIINFHVWQLGAVVSQIQTLL